MYESGMITKEQALMLVQPQQLDNLLHPQFDTNNLKEVVIVGEGLPASPGAACGKIVFNVKEAIERTQKGEKVVLVRLETSPEDIEGMDVSEGILTARGGMTSHAAVVARGMGKCCVSGCKTLVVKEDEGYILIGDKKFTREDYIALDGTTGNIYGGKVKTVPATISGNFEKIHELG